MPTEVKPTGPLASPQNVMPKAVVDSDVPVGQETNDLVKAVQEQFDLNGVAGYERDLAAFKGRIDAAVQEALKTNNKMSLAVFNNRLNVLINRASFGMIFRHRTRVATAATTFMSSKITGNK